MVREGSCLSLGNVMQWRKADGSPTEPTAATQRELFDFLWDHGTLEVLMVRFTGGWIHRHWQGQARLINKLFGAALDHTPVQNIPANVLLATV